MKTIDYPKVSVCTFELTHRCNLQCRHCYVTASPNSNELSTDEIKYILDKIDYGGCMWVKFTGGEPLIRNDFAAIYTYARRTMKVSVLTNATLLTSKLVKLFSKYPPHNIEVSIYGSSENAYRVFCNSGEAYYNALRALNLLSKAKIDFEIKTTVTKINKDEIPKIRDLALRYGCKFKYDTTLYPRMDGSWFSPDIILPHSEAIRFDFDNNLCENKLNAWMDMYARFIHKERSPSIYTCGSGSGYFNIDPFGNMNICHMFPRKPCYNLLRKPLKHGLKILDRLSRQRANPKKRCVRCKAYFLCNKCPAIGGPINSAQASFWNYYCGIAKLRLAKLGELYQNKRDILNV